MKEKLVATINEIGKNNFLLSSDEASIKNGVVLRLLSVLSWDPFDMNEVKPEYTVESKRVDFSLRINGINKAFIEVKRPNENLEPHQEQLLNYSFREGVKLAILTNGLTWWFYLPLNEGSWEQRRFYTADFHQQDPHSIAERFIELMEKSNIASGQAIENAENLYKSYQKKSILRDAIPKAWHKIVTDPDDRLVDLIIDTTEKLSGFRPEIDDVVNFLRNVVTSSETKTDNGHHETKVSGTRGLSEDYTNKVIRSFTLLGSIYSPHSWKELLVTVAEEMYRRHSSEFDRCLALRGPKIAFYSIRGNELRAPKQIAGSKYFVETNFSSNSIVRRSRELMALFGHRESDLSINAE